MASYRLYFGTNRNHEGADRWHPDGYGTKFSNDGMENLRFGVVTVEADEKKVAKFLKSKQGPCGKGDGPGLGDYLSKQVEKAQIDAFEESLDPALADVAQSDARLGSQALFAELMQVMQASSDVLIYIHGFNVSWSDAVGAALALQIMLRNAPERDTAQDVTVMLFTWPSNGQALPFASYKSDRSDAMGSGLAVGRGLLKTRDFLASLRDRARTDVQLCGQGIHLLCHSMGNYVLQNALARIDQFTPGNTLPRMFEHIFLCAPDVDDTALDAGGPMYRLHEMARSVSVYYNREDKALVISDYTKGNPDRLGSAGAAHPALLHNKVHQVNCTPVVEGLVEHSYYLVGTVNADIRASIDGWGHEDARRRRRQVGNASNTWEMKGA